MHIRVVRFTDVTQERIDGLMQRVNEGGGPPEGVISTGVQFLHDADQGTMIVVQKFASKEDMEQSEAALEGMDPSETPGSRQSIDRCEVVAELDG
jgi:hypothetical protein